MKILILKIILVFFFGGGAKWKLQKENFSSLKQWWNVGKIQIEVFCNQYAFNVTKDIVGYIQNLEVNIVEFQNLCDSIGDQDHFKSLKKKKKNSFG